MLYHPYQSSWSSTSTSPLVRARCYSASRGPSPASAAGSLNSLPPSAGSGSRQRLVGIPFAELVAGSAFLVADGLVRVRHRARRRPDQAKLQMIVADSVLVATDIDGILGESVEDDEE